MTASGPPLQGERDLRILLARLAPVLDPIPYAFCRGPDGPLPPGLVPLASFREEEAVTLILPEAAAEQARLECHFRARRIVLTVHSDLAAVGMLAAVAGTLAAAGIPCNVVAALHHDHLFVPAPDAARALAVLEALSREAAGGPAVIYAVTVEVEDAVAGEWLDWMRRVHVPEVLATGCFLDVEIARRVDPPPAEGTVVHVLEYRAASAARLAEYRERHAPALQRAHLERYGNHARASRTVREVLPDSAP